MVARDEQEVIRAHFRAEVAEPCVKRGGRGGVAVDVAAVSVDHIEVHEVDKGKAVKIAVEQRHGLLHAVRIARRFDGIGHALPRENIIDLADRDHIKPRVLQEVERGLVRRHERKVVAARGALERVFALKRARNDAPDAVLALADFARQLAVAVQLLDRHNALVRGDLQNAVRRGVNNQLAGPDVFPAVVGDDLRAGIGLVAEDAAPPCGREFLQKLLRKTVREGGHWLLRNDAAHLPVSDDGILAAGALGHAGIRARGRFNSAFNAVDVEQPELLHILRRKLRRAADGAEGIRARVTEIGAVGRRADAEAVQHDQKYALHKLPPV